jgi:hypothetical protein
LLPEGLPLPLQSEASQASTVHHEETPEETPLPLQPELQAHWHTPPEFTEAVP